MKFIPFAGPFAAAAILSCLSNAEAGILIPIPAVPGSTSTIVRGINDSNVIVGAYETSDGVDHGFTGSLDGQYITFDFPGADGYTIPQAIANDGTITGWVPHRDGTEDQFIRAPDGTMKAITFRGRKLRGAGSPGAILSTGAFVGWYEAERKDGSYRKPTGYLGDAGNYSSEITLPFKKVYGTYPRGLNNNGDVAGEYEPCSVCSPIGFLLEGGVGTQIEYPDQYLDGTRLAAINDQRIAVGYYYEYVQGDKSGPYAFLYDSLKGAYKRLPADTAFGINNSGLVAVNADSQPYIYCINKRTCPQSQARIKASKR